MGKTPLVSSVTRKGNGNGGFFSNASMPESIRCFIAIVEFVC